MLIFHNMKNKVYIFRKVIDLICWEIDENWYHINDDIWWVLQFSKSLNTVFNVFIFFKRIIHIMKIS